MAVDHGQRLVTQYAHLSEISVKTGDFVGGRALLGKVGSTGISTGPHLHFKVLQDGKTVDPHSAWLLSNKIAKDIFRDLR